MNTEWSEANSSAFIDYGKYFVFERELQIQTLCILAPATEGPFDILDLCCGEGLLAEALLERYPGCTVHGLDKSPSMLAAAKKRLARFGDRFVAQLFDLADEDWRQPAFVARFVVSSLAIHHLNADQKQALFKDVYAMLEPGGAFMISDLVMPENESGMRYAAWAYDDAVRERALKIDGHPGAFEEFKRMEWNYFEFPEDALDKPSPVLAQIHWLMEAGFEQLDIYWARAGHAIFGGYKL